MLLFFGRIFKEFRIFGAVDRGGLRISHPQFMKCVMCNPIGTIGLASKEPSHLLIAPKEYGHPNYWLLCHDCFDALRLSLEMSGITEASEEEALIHFVHNS
jgi:hypothetical protein